MLRFLRAPALFFALAAAAATSAACGQPGEPGPGQAQDSPPAASSPVARDVAPGNDSPNAPAALPFGAVTGRPVVYWIHTEWCTTCKRIRPEWPSIVDAYGSAVQLIMVDRDTPEGNAFARSHRINYQPGFVVLDANGNVTYAGLGPYTPAEVRQLVASAAARSSASR